MFHRHGSLLHLSRKSWNIAILFGLVTLVEGVLWYFMPIYFESKLNSLFLVGIIISSHPLASLLASLPAGDLCDKIGRKFVFVLGLLGFAASFVLLFVGNFQSMLLFMIFYGIFSTMYGIGAFVSILDHSKPRHAGESAGFFTTVQYAGWLFGSLIAGVLIILLEVSLMLKVLVLLLTLISSLSLFVFPGKIHFNFKEFSKVEHIMARDRIFLGEIKSISVIGRPLIAILAFAFVFGYWEYAIWTFEPIYTNSIGSSIILSAAILSLISLPYMISALMAGKLADIIESRKMLLIGVALIIFGQASFLLHQNLLTLAISLIVTSFGALFIWIPIDRFLKNHTDRNLRGEVDGAAEMFYNIGGVAGPLTIGIALSVAELSNLYYFTFALFAISMLTLVFLKDI